MTLSGKPLYWLAVILDLMPSVLLVLAWMLTLRSRGELSWARRWPLIALTGSSVWMIAGFIWPVLFGPTYSRLRFVIIDGNFLLSMIACVGAFFRWSRPTIATGIAGFVGGMAWAFLAAIKLRCEG
jgi:hypothetical protein